MKVRVLLSITPKIKGLKENTMNNCTPTSCIIQTKWKIPRNIKPIKTESRRNRKSENTITSKETESVI